MNVHINQPTVPAVFKFEEAAVRAVMIGNDPWFVARDVALALGIAQPDKAYQRLDDDEKGRHTVLTPGGLQEMTIVSEPGVYQLVFTSRTDRAKAFKRWLAHEVLPTLRRTGQYGLDYGCEDDELTAWGVPLRKLAVQNQTIRTILALEGIESARATARKDKTYPLARGYAIRELVDTSQDDPNGCLNHLFRSKVSSGGTVGSLFDLAVRDVASRPALRGHGLIIDPGGKRGYVAVASAHPFLRQAFALTQWADGWSRALRLVPGAVPTKKTLPFGGGASAAVLIPQRAILAVRQPEAA